MPYSVPTARSVDTQRKPARSCHGKIRTPGKKLICPRHSHRTQERLWRVLESRKCRKGLALPLLSSQVTPPPMNRLRIPEPPIMSPKKSLFNRYSSAEVTHRVQTVGGGTLLVKGVGDIPLSSLGIFKEVLHIEDLRAN